MAEGLEDADIMVKVGSGRPDLMEGLYARHGGPLLGFFLRVTGHRPTSEDLVQEVFLRALKYARSFKSGLRFKPWFYQIARNVHLDHLAKQKPEFDLEGHAECLIAEGGCPEQRVLQGEATRSLKEALEKLPPAKRELLLLSRDPDLSYQDLAALYGCSEGAVKVQVHRALKELRNQYFANSGGAK